VSGQASETTLSATAHNVKHCCCVRSLQAAEAAGQQAEAVFKEAHQQMMLQVEAAKRQQHEELLQLQVGLPVTEPDWCLRGTLATHDGGLCR